MENKRYKVTFDGTIADGLAAGRVKKNIDKGLWSQAPVKAKGDENLRKVEYMKLRVKQIKKTT